MSTVSSNNSSILIGVSNNTIQLVLEIILTILFFLVPLIFWFYFSRRMMIGNTTRSRRPKIYIPNIRWDEVYDLKEVKMRLEEIAKMVQLVKQQ